MPSFTILRGLPGSGKSTYIMNRLSDATVVSTDHFFVNENGEYQFDPELLDQYHQKCFDVFQEHVRNRVESIVLDNTNILLEHFQHYMDVAVRAGYDVLIVTFIPLDPETHFHRNIHDVPISTIESMLNQYQLVLDVPHPQIVITPRI